jgi:hypothetical protein
MKIYAIFAKPRSGTHYFRDKISRAFGLEDFGEVLSPIERKGFWKSPQAPKLSSEYLNTADRFVEYGLGLRPERPECQGIILDLKIDQLSLLHHEWQSITRMEGLGTFLAQCKVTPIILYRRDSAARIYSVLKAERTGLYHIEGSEKRTCCPIMSDALVSQAEVEEITLSDLKDLNFVFNAIKDCKPRIVCYEDFVAKWSPVPNQEDITRFGRKLNLAPASFFPQDRYRKVVPSIGRDIFDFSPEVIPKIVFSSESRGFETHNRFFDYCRRLVARQLRDQV